MIRILLALGIATAAYYGPWVLDAGSLFSEAGGLIHGDAFAGPTAKCLLAGDISISGECAPGGALFGKMVTVTVALGLVAAVLGILGLLPVIGRITSIFTVLAAIAAIATLGVATFTLLTQDGGDITQLRWGGMATGGFGLLGLFAGAAGMRGNDE